MKTIGLLGGTSWESTVLYYQILNRSVHEKLGGKNFAKVLLYSYNFQELRDGFKKGGWEKTAEMMIDGAKRLESGGADFVLICTNTVHNIADKVEKAISIPLLHIVDVTAEKIKEANIDKIGLLGSKFTMELPFYKEKLKQKYDIESVIPENEKDRNFCEHVIFNELFKGISSSESKNRVKRIIEDLAEKGAKGIILGCTELPLMIKQSDSPIPVFDTTTIHAQRAAEMALE